MRHLSLSSSKISLVFCSLLILAIAAGLGLAKVARAQTGAADWSEPRNLSNSGASTQPRLVVDSDGATDVLWLDEFSGVVAIQGKNGTWSEATPISLPIGKNFASMKLVAGSNGFIHAAWTNEKGILFYAWVRNENFSTPGGWSAPQQLALSVADFDLDVSPQGEQQLAFVRSDQAAGFPAGVYAIQSSGTGGFASPVLLYASPYYRGLDAEGAQVSLATGTDGVVLVAWDERPQEVVYRALSADGGETWSKAEEVDQRQPGDGGGDGPARPVVSVQGQRVLLVWGAGHQGGNCAQYSQASLDGGQTWEQAVRLPEPFSQACAEDLQLLERPDGSSLAFADSPSGVTLLTWSPANGGKWSSSRVQSALSGFTHPETYRPVSLDCRQPALAGDTLLVAGCERETPGDIWLMERSLEDTAAWFPTPTATPPWSTPHALASGPQALNDPLLLADSAGRLHALWTRQEDENLYYAVWDGTRWTAAQAILASPGQSPQGLTAALHPNGLLFVAWSDPSAGGLFYSLAVANQALNPAEWSAPQELPAEGTPAAPQALAQQDGRLAVAYAAPFNEGRGIYLVESRAEPQAGGRLEWDEAQMIFDAAAAGWDSSSEPRLAEDPDGGLHLLWTRYSLPPLAQALGLYAARETAGGWSAPEQVYAGQILWSQVLAAPGASLHRAWRATLSGQAVVFHQYSLDGGLSWSEATRLSGMQNASGPSGLAVEASGRLNLLQVVENTRPAAIAADSQAPVMQRWVWEEGSWTQVESQALSGLLSAAALSAAAPAEGLAALFSGQELAQATPGAAGAGIQPSPEALFGLFASGRKLAGGAGEPASTGSESTAFTPEAAVTTEEGGELATPSPSQPAVTPTFSTQPPSSFSNLLSGRIATVLIAAIPAVLLIAVAIFFGARQISRRR